MEQINDSAKLLELLLAPVFCVKDNIITEINETAARLFLREGMKLETILESGAQEFAELTDGLLYVTLVIYGQLWGASVTRIGEKAVFVIDQQFESEELKVLALAARELRAPLSNAMLAAQHMEPSDETSRLNRGLNQLLRIIGNMSDASAATACSAKEYTDVDAFFRELIEKSACLAEKNGIRITYHGTDSPAFCAVDRQQIERAALNMISNAIKFSPPNGEVRVTLHNSGNLLRFAVSDSGAGIPENIQSTMFRRYLREPCIEDARHGIGLGMVLVRNFAAKHGGAVLVDHPENHGTRVSMTIPVVNNITPQFNSPRLRMDYAGEQDHVLIELSECLSHEFY